MNSNQILFVYDFLYAFFHLYFDFPFLILVSSPYLSPNTIIATKGDKDYFVITLLDFY